jgi:hypothetical protein
MTNWILDISNVTTIASKLQEDYKLRFGVDGLSWPQALQLAVQIERNNIFISAFKVSEVDKYPSALEKIAMELERIADKNGDD